MATQLLRNVSDQLSYRLCVRLTGRSTVPKPHKVRRCAGFIRAVLAKVRVKAGPIMIENQLFCQIYVIDIMSASLFVAGCQSNLLNGLCIRERSEGGECLRQLVPLTGLPSSRKCSMILVFNLGCTRSVEESGGSSS